MLLVYASNAPRASSNPRVGMSWLTVSSPATGIIRYGQKSLALSRRTALRATPPPAAKRVGVTLLLAINQLARAPTIASQIAHIITETTIAPTPCPV